MLPAQQPELKMMQNIRLQSSKRHLVFLAIGTVENLQACISILDDVLCTWHDHPSIPPVRRNDIIRRISLNQLFLPSYLGIWSTFVDLLPNLKVSS